MTARPDRNSDKFAWHEALLTDPALRSMSAKVLAGYLMHRFDRRTLTVEIAEATLAEDLDWSVSTVKRAVSVLRKRGWLLVSTGRYGANLYRPNMALVPMCQDRVKALRKARNEARLTVDGVQPGTAHRLNVEPGQGSELSPIPLGRSLGDSHFTAPPSKSSDQDELEEKQEALLDRFLEAIKARSARMSISNGEDC